MGAPTAPAVSRAPAAASRPRLAGSDAVRAIAMIGVIGIHASAWGPPAPYASVDRITRFSVPAFMVLTGLLLAYQYTGRPLGMTFMRRRLGRSLLPWLAWVPVYIVFDFLIGTMHVSGASVLSFLQYGGGHLWFLLLIPQFYVLFALWPRRGSWVLAAVAMAVQTGLNLLRLYAVLPGWESQVMLSYSVLLFPFWIGYFAVGVAAGRSLAAQVRRRTAPSPAGSWQLPAAVLGAVAVAASGYLLLNLHYPNSPYAHGFLRGTGAFLDPVLPVFVFSVVVWLFIAAPPLMRASRPLARTIDLLSEQSLGLYIVHPIFLWFIGRAFVTGIGAGGAVSVLAFFAFMLCTLLATMLAVRLISATPLAVTIGVPQRPLALRLAVAFPPAKADSARR